MDSEETGACLKALNRSDRWYSRGIPAARGVRGLRIFQQENPGSEGIPSRSEGFKCSLERVPNTVADFKMYVRACRLTRRAYCTYYLAAIHVLTN